MTRTVTSSEAQNNFGAMVQWAEENDDGIVVERRGKPAAAIVSYDVYQKLIRLRERERTLQALHELRALRDEVQQLMPVISDEEAYREAGFSERIIQETVQSDKELR